MKLFKFLILTVLATLLALNCVFSSSLPAGQSQAPSHEGVDVQQSARQSQQVVASKDVGSKDQPKAAARYLGGVGGYEQPIGYGQQSYETPIVQSYGSSYTAPLTTSYGSSSYVAPVQSYGSSYVQPSYQQSSYVQPSYQQSSYVQPSYQQSSYVQPSYQQSSYVAPVTTYEQPIVQTYQQQSYVQPSYSNYSTPLYGQSYQSSYVAPLVSNYSSSYVVPSYTPSYSNYTTQAYVPPVTSYQSSYVAPTYSNYSTYVPPVQSYGSSYVQPVQSYGSSYVQPVQSYGSSYVQPVQSYGSSYVAPVQSYETPVYNQSYVQPVVEQYVAPVTTSYQSSYVQPSYQQSYVQPSYQQSSYVQPSYQQQSYVQPTYQQQSYVQPTYQQQSYVQPTYQQSYVQPSYQQSSYVQPTYQGNQYGSQFGSSFGVSRKRSFPESHEVGAPYALLVDHLASASSENKEVFTNVSAIECPAKPSDYACPQMLTWTKDQLKAKICDYETILTGSMSLVPDTDKAQTRCGAFKITKQDNKNEDEAAELQDKMAVIVGKDCQLKSILSGSATGQDQVYMLVKSTIPSGTRFAVLDGANMDLMSAQSVSKDDISSLLKQCPKQQSQKSY